MTGTEVYELYLKELGSYNKRGWRLPADWEKVKADAKWKFFEALAISAGSQMALVDVADFFKANFELRYGKFYPYMFTQKQSFVNYSRWKKMPKKVAEESVLAESILKLAAIVKNNQLGLDDLLDTSVTYPLYLRYYVSGTLHKWILAYMSKRVNPNLLSETPTDIILHAFSKGTFTEVKEQVDFWYMQLINKPDIMKLVGSFVDKIKAKKE
jgi:hypothetical protein